MKILGRLFLISLLVMATGCVAGRPPKDYTALKAAKPRSILVVPVVNKSVDVTASDYFLSSVTIPLAELGYYVFPVNMVKRVLEDNGLSDAAMVHGAPAERLASLFDADSVLYITIERWDAQYLVLTTQVTVELDYVLKDGKTGNTLWQERRAMVYQPQSHNTGNPIATLVVMAVQAAITKAAPNYMPLARQCNGLAFYTPEQGLLPGPYIPATKEP